MRKLVSIFSVASLAFGSFCPIQMAVAMPVDSMPMQYEEMVMTPMTPPMSPIALMSVAPVSGHRSHTMPLTSSGNCTTGHCFVMDHSGRWAVAMNTSAYKLIRSASALPVTILLVPQSMDSLPAPPFERGSTSLAQTVSTIVLRV